MTTHPHFALILSPASTNPLERAYSTPLSNYKSQNPVTVPYQAISILPQMLKAAGRATLQ